ncbi:MAG: bifunctional precorrin-2 dehydrogenase/sirohydrochlorin ferrochelatase [Bacillota bacterium]
MEDYCPLLIDLRGRKCLVVGGGRVALRKVRTLLKARARVLLVSPSLHEELEALAATGKIACRREVYYPAHLQGVFLAVGCSDVAAVNRRLAAHCRSRGLLVNIADNPALCNFFFPSVVSRGPLSIAVSTEGKSPALARRLRLALEKEFSAAYADFVRFLGRLRPQILTEVADAKQREALLHELAGEPFFAEFLHLSPEDREKKAQEVINAYWQPNTGKINRKKIK